MVGETCGGRGVRWKLRESGEGAGKLGEMDDKGQEEGWAGSMANWKKVKSINNSLFQSTSRSTSK